MDERLRRSRRILALQSQLANLAEWKLVDLQSQTRDLEDKQRNLIRFISEEPEVAALFSFTVMRRLKMIAENLAIITGEQKEQKGRKFDEQRRLRCIEQIVAVLDKEMRRKDTLGQIAETIEAAIQCSRKPPASY
jgi:hypothetical protein